MRDFPNSTFSQEVRGMLDKLRQRAADQRAAGGEEAGSTAETERSSAAP